MQEVRNGRVFHYKRQLYTLAVILLAVLFFYFLHIALYHCPKNNVSQEKGEESDKVYIFVCGSYLWYTK